MFGLKSHKGGQEREGKKIQGKTDLSKRKRRMVRVINKGQTSIGVGVEMGNGGTSAGQHMRSVLGDINKKLPRCMAEAHKRVASESERERLYHSYRNEGKTSKPRNCGCGVRNN